MALKDFIPTDKQPLVSEAIERAEKLTSGEIVVGARLSKYFPVSDNDVNELSNEISYEE